MLASIKQVDVAEKAYRKHGCKAAKMSVQTTWLVWYGNLTLRQVPCHICHGVRRLAYNRSLERAYENPQYWSLGCPKVWVMLNMSLATSVVPTYGDDWAVLFAARSLRTLYLVCIRETASIVVFGSGSASARILHAAPSASSAKMTCCGLVRPIPLRTVGESRRWEEMENLPWVEANHIIFRTENSL